MSADNRIFREFDGICREVHVNKVFKKYFLNYFLMD